MISDFMLFNSRTNLFITFTQEIFATGKVCCDLNIELYPERVVTKMVQEIIKIYMYIFTDTQVFPEEVSMLIFLTNKN